MSEVITTQGGRKRTKERASNVFSLAQRQKFLDALAATCNITKAADHAQANPSTVYRLRARDAAFAEQWRAAMMIGFERLEALVLEHGGAGGTMAVDPDRAHALAEELAPFDFDKAMNVLRYARTAFAGQPSGRTGRPRRDATRADTNAALLKAIAAVRRSAREGGDD